jgi:hypothetical protein
MPLPYLSLGPISFQAFELPGSISWGGAQQLAIHRLPGGTRIIDAMGRDDADIMWSGVFTGPDAAARARLLDLMRSEGNCWSLTWDSFFYSVIVARFEADQQRPNWIPYKISCCVLRDEAAALLEMPLSLVATAAQDMATAASLAPASLPANLDAELVAATNIGQATALAAAAAQQAASAGYLARAGRNTVLN